MTRLRIALVAHHIHFRGGMERCCAELATRLCREHDVHLFTCEADDVPLDRLTVHRIHAVQKPFLRLWTQFYRSSSRLIRPGDFDIVHTIGGITAHQNIVTAQFCHYAWGSAIKREPGARGGVTAYHQFLWRLNGFYEKRAMTASETLGISANSKQTQLDLVNFYGCDPAKIGVIYNGVDSDRFTPGNARFRAEVRARYGITEDALVVLFVGEYRRKGLATVIEALGMLKDPCLHLLAVGRGDAAQYQALAAQAGIEGSSTFGPPARNIEQVFGASDIFAFPTYYEPFGMVITEAMASGLPVITSRRAGASELIEDGVSGLLLDQPANGNEMAAKIALLAGDRSLRVGMGRKGRPAASRVTWNEVAEDTLALYARCLGKEAPVSAAYGAAR